MTPVDLQDIASLNTREPVWALVLHPMGILTSKSIFFATCVFSAIHAKFPSTTMSIAFPASSIGEPSDFVLSAFCLRA